MALKQETIEQPKEDRYDKYMHCDICGNLLVEAPIFITINKLCCHYADVIRCPKDNKLFSIKFRYTDIPSIIDNNDIRERIKRHQQSAFVGRYYEYSELVLGRMFKPKDDETFEEFKVRFKKYKEDFYKENDVWQKQ